MKMGLNIQQINIVASSIPKRQYYLVCEKGSRLFELAIQPISLAFCGISDRDAVLKIKKLEQQHPENWPQLWLEQRGVDLAAFDFDRLDKEKEEE